MDPPIEFMGIVYRNRAEALIRPVRHIHRDKSTTL